MDNEKIQRDAGTILEPLIDSRTPPVGVDNVIIGASSAGGIRISGFSGNLFEVKRDTFSTEDGNVLRVWAVPTCVMDLSPYAVQQLVIFLLLHFSTNAKELKELFERFPDAKENLKAVLSETEKV